MRHAASAIFIDEGGMGAGVVDMIRRMLPERLVSGMNFGGKADRYMMGSDLPLVADKAAEMQAAMRPVARDRHHGEGSGAGGRDAANSCVSPFRRCHQLQL